MKTKITVLTGLPGCGKTQKVIQDIVAAPGRYLFATSRIGLLDERSRDIEAAAAVAGVELRIQVIHSNLPDRRTVARRIEDAPADFADHEHVVLLVTHEGLMSA